MSYDTNIGGLKLATRNTTRVKQRLDPYLLFDWNNFQARTCQSSEIHWSPSLFIAQARLRFGAAEPTES